jgi:hypothetical protein
MTTQPPQKASLWIRVGMPVVLASILGIGWYGYLMFWPIACADSLFTGRIPTDRCVVIADWSETNDGRSRRLMLTGPFHEMPFVEKEIREITGDVTVRREEFNSRLRVGKVTVVTVVCAILLLVFSCFWWHMIGRLARTHVE